jgi:hypothetical protein
MFTSPQLQQHSRARLLSSRIATILAALRYYQANVVENGRSCAAADPIATAGGTLKPLTAEAIDELCEDINCGGLVAAPQISISDVTDGYNRFVVARDIQDASNPSGVARELVRVIYAAMRDPDCKGTDDVRRDPAVRCVVDKLSSLMIGDALSAHGENARRLTPAGE